MTKFQRGLRRDGRPIKPSTRSFAARTHYSRPAEPRRARWLIVEKLPFGKSRVSGELRYFCFRVFLHRDDRKRGPTPAAVMDRKHDAGCGNRVPNSLDFIVRSINRPRASTRWRFFGPFRKSALSLSEEKLSSAEDPCRNCFRGGCVRPPGFQIFPKAASPGARLKLSFRNDRRRAPSSWIRRCCVLSRVASAFGSEARQFHAPPTGPAVSTAFRKAKPLDFHQKTASQSPCLPL